VSSYRTDAGAEVDIVLDTGEKLLAIECKYGKNVTEALCSGLRSFETIAHKPLEKYLVYQGETRQKFSQGELAIPYQEFLLEILPNS
jgi:predicted AAA+ superfamily ATPase